MNRFNLSFSGEILPGQPPEQVKLRFGKLFAIDDPERVERFFSGETIILRRNLERKAAAECFQQMRKIGAVAELVKISVDHAANSTAAKPQSSGKKPAQPRPSRRPSRRQERTESTTKQTREKTLQQQEELAARQRREAEQQAQKQAAERERAEAEQQRREEERERKAAEKLRREQARQQRQAQRQSQREEKRRHAAEEAARLKAQRQQARALRDREQAEARARAAVEQEKAAQQRRLAAEVVARQKILEEERQREEHARREAQAKQEQEQRKRVELEAAQQAARAAAEQRAREERARREQQAERQLLEERAIQRAAQELTGGAAGRPVKARVKTRLDVSGRSGGRDGAASQGHKRQPGEPNLYQLRPFRNSRDVRERAARARSSQRRCLAGAALAAALLAAIAVLAQRFPAPAAVHGADSIAADAAGNLVMLAGGSLLVHDRAGRETASTTVAALGVYDLSGSLDFAADGALLAMGRVSAAAPTQLLRCDLQSSVCNPLPGIPDAVTVAAYALHPLDGGLFVADSAAGELYKIDRDGEIIGRRTLDFPPHPVLRLHSGLLLMNSPHGPAVSVFRYDDNAFGEQLDEILLLPAAAVAAGQDRVGEFVYSAGAWWVVIFNDETGAASVFRFDDQWTELGPVTPATRSMPLSLISWGPRTLVNDHRQVAVARFGEHGESAAPLESDALLAVVEERRRSARLRTTGWRSGLALCALLLVAALARAYLQRVRVLVYGSQRIRGAEPVEDYRDALRWIPPLTDRRNRLRRIGISGAVLAIAGCLLAIGAGASTAQLAALLLALSGLAAALSLLARRPIGHIALLGDRLLLADHAGTYHIGGDANIQYRGGFLAMDDVVVFTGNALLPAFQRDAIRAGVTPLSSGGVRVDRKTMAVKLLQSRHPVALAVLSCAGGVAAGLFVLTASALFPGHL